MFSIHQPFYEENNYYSLLNVPLNANDAQISHSYRSLSNIFHPDKNLNSSSICSSTVGKLNEAYSILSSPYKRTIYDKYGLMGLEMFRPFDWYVLRTYYNTEASLYFLENQILNMKKSMPFLSPYYKCTINKYLNFKHRFLAYNYIDSGTSLYFQTEYENKKLTISPMFSSKLNNCEIGIKYNINTHDPSISFTLAKIPIGFLHSNYDATIEVNYHFYQKKKPEVVFHVSHPFQTFEGSLVVMLYPDPRLVMLIQNSKNNYSNQPSNNEYSLSLLVMKHGSSEIDNMILPSSYQYQISPAFEYNLFKDISFTFQSHIIIQIFTNLSQLPQLFPVFEVGFIFNFLHSKWNIKWTCDYIDYGVKIKFSFGNNHFDIPFHYSFTPSLIVFGVSNLLFFIYQYLLKYHPFPTSSFQHKPSSIFLSKKGKELFRVYKEAQQAQKILIPLSQHILKQEKQKNGLIIHKAIYGQIDKSNIHNLENNLNILDIPLIIDVTVVLQAFVHESSLFISSHSKVDCFGFCDPLPCENYNQLFVHYSFLNIHYEVLIHDLQPLYLPSIHQHHMIQSK